MLKNYLKIAWRNLIRNRTISMINITGLGMGIATCLLIGLYVLDELAYDRFNQKADRIARVVFKGIVQGGVINEAHVMPPVAAAMKNQFPEVEESARLRIGGRPFFVVGDQVFNDENLAYVDASFFKIFTLPLVSGDVSTVLANPNDVVLSESTARKYFGTTNVIGKSLQRKSNEPLLKITGVMKDIPQNSHFHFDIFTSLEVIEDARSSSWMTSEYYTYLLRTENTDWKTVEEKLPSFFEKYAAPQFMGDFGMSYQDYRKSGNSLGLYLQPLTDIHLRSDFAYDLGIAGDIRYVYIFGVIALFMLLIATINFMNLSTAGGSKRSKEVGVRKVLGAGRGRLALQFFTEGVLVAYIGLLIAVCIVLFLLPLFNQLSGKSLSVQSLSLTKTIPFLLLFGLLVGLIAGSYPALYLTSFNPISVLKGRFKLSGKGLSLRSGLVVFQFMISIGLIFCTLVVSRQLDYIRGKKLGYEKENVLILQTWPLGEHEKVFKTLLLQDSRISYASRSSYLPAGDSYNNNFFVHPEGSPGLWVKSLRYDVDEEYLPAMGIELKEGRNFSAEYGNDTLSAVLNEAAVRSLGWKESVLGKTIINKDNKGYRVIGVVKDFHFKSLHETISPLVMVLNNQAGSLILKIRPTDTEKLLSAVEKIYNSFPSDLPFSYSFLDDRYNNTYLAERKTGQLLSIFTGLTIFVACLGLLGLAIFTADQRKKEISIRKVIGASVPRLVGMLSAEFLKLVLIALVIASPLAWWVMNQWLEDFAYRIDIEWWMFAIAGFLAIAIAMLTVSSQAIKVALANPVDRLRSE